MNFLDNIKSVPITDFAERSGFTLVRKGKYYSLKEHDSVIIDTNKNCFWRNSRFAKGFSGGAGSVIDFAIEFNGARDAKEAMRQIAVMYGIEGEKEATIPYQKPSVATQQRKEYKVGEVELPERDSDNRRVYAYLLKTRGIEQSVIRYFLGKKMLYQEKEHKNCVFHAGTVFACVRSTMDGSSFKMDLEGCDYNECFFFRGSNAANTLVVAESVIDIMSIMSQFCREKKKYTDYCYLALAGAGKVESVAYHIEKEEAVGKPFQKILAATDNDAAGEKAAEHIAMIANSFGVECERFAAPCEKDWNEYLVKTGGVVK